MTSRRTETARRILIIDEDSLFYRALERMLTQVGGAEVTTTATLAEALHAASSNSIDLAFVDRDHRANKLGYDIAQALRVLCPRLPIVLMSVSKRRTGFAPGVSYLRKPFHERQLMVAMAVAQGSAPPPRAQRATSPEIPCSKRGFHCG